jgi:polyisoprenyl-teichoic acid--peptidoglycan teichoic acid transferase
MRRAAGLWTLLFLILGSWVAFGALTTEPHRAAAQTPIVEISRVQDASFSPVRERDRPLAILVIGSDARPGEPVDGRLADALQIVTVHPDLEGATILGIPRDAYVSIPGVGQRKINESLYEGGPELVVRTVEELSGIPIDYYVLTSFQGVVTMVNRIGGLEVDIPYAMSDSASGAFFEPGVQELDGHDVLALARNRKSTPDGDFSRSENQGLILLSALQRFHADYADDPFVLFRWIAVGASHVITDLDIGEKVELALTALQLDPADVTSLVAPGGTGMAGSASVVHLADSVRAIFEDMADDGLLAPGAGG